jgi:hypothetical protein
MAPWVRWVSFSYPPRSGFATRNDISALIPVEVLKGSVPARRQFIKRMLRNASLAVLGLAGGGLALKRRRLLREGKCLNQGMCRDCGVFADCGLPRALSTRSVLARTRHGQ